jgi:hypothetical protein
MIPLMYLLLLVEFLAKKWILLVNPIVRSGTSPSTYVNLVLIAGLALSLRSTVNRQPQE